jgi:HK97 family phage prohead protease
MNNKLEQRSFFCEVRAEQNDDNGTYITGRPIVYDSAYDNGYFIETIQRGALDETDLKDVRFLVNHDLRKIPLARSRRNNKNSTMQLSVDDGGLSIRANLDVEHNKDAEALYSAVSRGDISGMSFMFSIDDEEWSDLNTDKPKRTITKIGTVIEVSAVTLPAYEDTEINVARNSQALENAKLTLENVRKSSTNSVDTELEILKIKTQLL